MLKTTYIHHHLGLGDHIVCNGLVHNLIKDIKGPIELACKHHNVSSVKQLYRNSNIIIDPVSIDSEAESHYDEKNIIKIGFGHCRDDWEHSFYDQFGLDYQKRFDDFYIDRDNPREELLLHKLGLPDDYAFVNVSGSIGKCSVTIDTDKPIVELSPLTDSLFDWIPVILNASEVHTIDSAVFHLIKQLPITNRKVFYDVRKGSHVTTYGDDCWEMGL